MTHSHLLNALSIRVRCISAVHTHTQTHTCAKYSSEIRPAHSMQSSSGLQGFATSAHLINILLISSRFSGEFLMLASESLFTLCRRDTSPSCICTAQSNLAYKHIYGLNIYACIFLCDINIYLKKKYIYKRYNIYRNRYINIYTKIYISIAK